MDLFIMCVGARGWFDIESLSICRIIPSSLLWLIPRQTHRSLVAPEQIMSSN